MNLKNFISSLALMSLFCSCGGSGGGGGGALNAMSAGITAVNTQLNNAAGVITASKMISNQNALMMMAPSSTGLDDLTWADAGSDIPDLYNGSNYSLKEWFIDEFNPDFVNDNGAKVTFVGRIANATNLICFLAELGFPTDATNLPTNGVHTGTLTSAMATTCGDAGAAGTSITLTVSATTNTTLYDKNFSADVGSACPFLFKVRMNASEINIATSEDQSCDDRDQASSSVIQYNKITDVVRFTYISQAFSGGVISSPDASESGFEFYRGYYDVSADEAYILGTYGTDDRTGGAGGLTGHVAYAVVGKPTAGGSVALSAKVKGYTIVDDVYNACVDSNTMVATSTVGLGCTMTGVDVAAAFAGTIVTAHDANSTITDIYNITETQAVGFTDNTDMF